MPTVYFLNYNKFNMLHGTRSPGVVEGDTDRCHDNNVTLRLSKGFWRFSNSQIASRESKRAAGVVALPAVPGGLRAHVRCRAPGGKVVGSGRGWALPKRGPLINLRGENVGSAAGYRDAFASRRCAVVSDAFYEWPPTKGSAPTLYHQARPQLWCGDTWEKK